jgi:hypothetical protein
LGYSCRKVEKQLRAKFPKADVPNHATIARWVRIRPNIGTRLLRSHTIVQWWRAANRAGEIVLSRMDEIEKQPWMKQVVAYGRMMDTAIALEKLENERRSRQGSATNPSGGMQITVSTD